MVMAELDKRLEEELTFGGLDTKTKRWLKPQQKGSRREAITPAEYSGLQEAYDHFNKELFGGKLPDVFITYQRKARSLGYFSADRFNGRLDKTGRHELALNPDGFIGNSDKEICS